MKTAWLWIFVVVGVLLMAGAVALQINRASEQASMIETVGRVVDIQEGCVTAEFLTAQQELVRFNGSVCQKPPAFALEEQVPVIYAPWDPEGARINTFGQNWFLSLLLGGMGAVFVLAGGALVAVVIMGPKRAAQRAIRLKQTGRSIQAHLMSVEPNVAVTLNGRHPWRIVAQWLDPVTRKVHLFHSQNLWYDPSPYLTMKEVQVWIDPDRPRHYSLDTTFLPELG